jgi:thiamine biosynthesis lipoprotein
MSIPDSIAAATRWLVCLCLLAGPAVAEWHSASADKMGTRMVVQLWHEDPVVGQQLLAAAMAEFDRIEEAMSTYRESSEISVVNRDAAGQAVVVSQELFDLIARAVDLGAQTGGAFDITYDSVGQLYDYRAGQRPDAEAINARLAAIDYRLVQLDESARSIHFAREGVRINLGGIAKGHAVEAVIDQLRAAGVQHALATAGGDTRLLGDRRGKPWIVGIRDPDDEQGLVTRLALQDEAISTSGDYERFFDDADGQRYHHILQPATGSPARGLRSVTVLGPDATVTDGLSTSVFVLGAEAGLQLIEALPGYEAVLVSSDRQVSYSAGLDPR